MENQTILSFSSAYALKFFLCKVQQIIASVLALFRRVHIVFLIIDIFQNNHMIKLYSSHIFNLFCLSYEARAIPGLLTYHGVLKHIRKLTVLENILDIFA